MEHAALVAEFTSRWPEYRVGPALSRISVLMDPLGNPERVTPVIQVAGTNGKGSTCIMIDALLRAAGLRTGRSSSPHLSDARERISINGEPIFEERFAGVWGEIGPFVRMVDERKLDGIDTISFEAITGVAYAAFADAPVDVAVAEVGLGGNWSATSVVTPQVLAVSPIDLDHTHILGDSLEKVTFEKAGITKPGAMAVLAGQEPVTVQVLLARVVEVGVVVEAEGPDFGLLEHRPAVGGQMIRIQFEGGPMGDLSLLLHGACVACNVTLSVATVEASLSGQLLKPGIIEEGLVSVMTPARLELVRTSPAIAVGTTHNPWAARVTIEACREASASQPLVGVVGMMADKNTIGVLEIFIPAMDQVVVTRAWGISRSLPVDELVRTVEEIWPTGKVQKASGMANALELATLPADAAGPTTGVLVAGSLVVVGEARDPLAREQEASS